MSKFSDWLGSVLAELRRRNVLQVGAGYAVAAWVAFQVAAVVLRDALFLPPWVLTLVVVVGILGFPIALFLAWRYDLTSEGIQRAEPWDAEDAPEEPTRHRVAVALTVVAAIATVGASWAAMRAWSAARSGPDETRSAAASADVPALEPTRIAVLPFDDHSSDGELAGIARGLTGDLIHELDRVEGLELVSYTGVQPFREPKVTLDSVARILRAGTLIEGSVEPAGDSLALSINLVDGATDTRMASFRILGLRDSLLALRSSLVEGVSRQLRQRLGSSLELQQLRSETGSDRAWEHFHRARETRFFADTLALRGDTTSAGALYDRADSLLSTVDSIDPDWPAPTVERARIALARAQLGSRSTTDLDTSWLRVGDSLAGEALAIEPGESDALGLRGVLRYRASRVPAFEAAWASPDSAETDLRGAVASDPEHARAWAELSLLLERSGRRPEAVMAARRSKEADPFLGNDEMYLFSSAFLELNLQNFDAAERLSRRGRRLFPQVTAFDVLHLQLLTGPRGPEPDPDTAWALLTEVEDRFGGRWPPGRLLVAGALVRAGLADSGAAMLGRAKEAAPTHPWTLYVGANVHLQLGQPDSAIALLRRYLVDHPDERDAVAEDWWFDALDDDPAFRELVGAAGRGDGAESSGQPSTDAP